MRNCFDFSSYTAERTKDFSGREWVFKAINDWLTKPEGSRFFLLTGMPGSGKTAIAGRLYQFAHNQVATPDGLVSFTPGFLNAGHFCSARDGSWIDPRTFSQSIAMQLAKIPEYAHALTEVGDKAINIRAQVTVGKAQEKAVIAGVIIENLVLSGLNSQEAFNRTVLDPLQSIYSSGYNKQIIILVDALDESLAHKGDVTIVGLLSRLKNLPSKVRFILTSRKDPRVENEFLDADILFLSSTQFDKYNQEDIGGYVNWRLDHDKELSEKVAKLTAEQIAKLTEMITRKADGNFQYITFLLNAIAKGQQSLDDLEGLPPGLDGLYYVSLARVVELANKEWSQNYLPLMSVLSVAQESLTLPQLQAFTGQSESIIWVHILDLLQFIEETRPKNEQSEEENRYQLYHQSVIDFLHSRQFTVEKELYNWNNIPGIDNGRLLEFLNRHFGIEWVKTAKIEKIDGDNTINVYNEKNSLSLRLNSEKTKVNIKIDDGRTDKFIAKTENSKLKIYEKKRFTNTYYLPPEEWNRQIANHYWKTYNDKWQECDNYGLNHLAIHLFNSKQNDRLQILISKEWMQARYKRNRYTYTGFLADVELAWQEALARKESNLLLLIRLQTVREVVNREVSLYNNIDLQTLVWLGLEDEALAHARLRVEPMNRFEGLLNIYNTLKEKGKPNSVLLDEISELARAIPKETERVISMRDLAKAFAQAGNYDRAEETARSIPDAEYQTQALVDLVEILTEADHVDKARKVARNIQDNWHRVKVLSKLVEKLTSAGGYQAEEMFDEIEEAAHAIINDNDRASSLTRLAKVLAKARKYDRFLYVSSAIQIEWRRMQALISIAAELDKAGDKRASALFNEAHKVASAIKDQEGHMSAMAIIAYELTEAKRFDKALKAAQAIIDNEQQSRALSELALALSKNKCFKKAKEVISLIQIDRDRDETMTGLSIALCSAGYLNEALEVAQQIRSDWYRATALCKLGKELHKAGDIRTSVVFKEMKEAAARSWSVESLFPTPGYAVLELHELAETLIEADHYDMAMDLAYTIQDPRERANTLDQMAIKLAKIGDSRAKKVFDEAKEVVRAAQDNLRSDTALSKLVTALAQTGYFDIAKEVACSIGTDWEQDGALATLAVQLIHADRIDEAREITHSIRKERVRAEALSELAMALTESKNGLATALFEEARNVALNIPYEIEQMAALYTVAEALATARRFTESLELFRTTQTGKNYMPSTTLHLSDLRRVAEGIPRYLSAFVASLVLDGQIDEACKVACSIQENETRVYVLRTLAIVLAQIGDNRACEVFVEAWETASYIPDNQSPVDALSVLKIPMVQARNNRSSAVFDDLGKVARSMQDKKLQTVALSDLATALTKTGNYNTAEDVARAIPNDQAQVKALCELTMALAQAGHYIKVEEIALSIQNSLEDVRDMRILSTALAQAKCYDQANKIASIINDHHEQTNALGDLAIAFAKAGRYKEALTTIGAFELDEFLRALTEWSPYFEQEYPGFLITVLREATGVAGWVRKDWSRIHELFSTQKDSGR